MALGLAGNSADTLGRSEGNQKLNLDEGKTSANIHEVRNDSGEDGSSEKLQT